MIPSARAASILAVLSVAVSAQDEPATPEDRAAAVALRRAGGVRLEPLHSLAWGEGDSPALFQSPSGPLLNQLVFTTDSHHLAVQSNYEAWVLDLRTAKWSQLDLVTLEGSVEGPGAGGGFLVAAGGSWYRTGPGLDEPVLLAEDLPERADGFPAPGGQQLVVSGLTASRRILVQLVDLARDERARLAAPERSASATAVAWSPDGTRLAVAWGMFTAARRTTLGVRLYDRKGELLRDWPGDDGGSIVRSMEFAFDARSLTVANGGIRRLDLQSGDVLARADATPLFWGNVDPVVAVSVEENGITLWDAARLRPARTVPADEAPVEIRGRPKGPVLRAALSPKCDLLVLGTVHGLRVYRVRP